MHKAMASAKAKVLVQGEPQWALVAGPAAAAAASAKSVFLLFSASKVLIVKGMGPRWPVKVEVDEAPLEPASGPPWSWRPFFLIPFPF